MSPYDQAIKYVEAIPGSIDGQGGHKQTFQVACALINGFALSRGESHRILSDYNRRCQPPWNEKELEHKLDSAEKPPTPHDKPKGHLLHSKSKASASGSRNNSQSVPTPRPQKKIDLTQHYANASELPEAIPDGAREYIKALFREGESVRIASARIKTDEDGKQVIKPHGVPAEEPDGGGITLTREMWLKKLDAVKGNPNGIWSVNSKKAKQPGIYVALNPYKVGSTKDADVTDYRLTLVEFDEQLTPEEQFKLYIELKLPCAAITYSGDRSVHAAVKIEASNKVEYDERVKLLHDYLTSAGLPVDPKNKNVGRFSRLPNCQRFDQRQELLALNTGCASFSEWIMHIGDDELPTPETFDSLSQLDPKNDPGCVIGFDRHGHTTRYLCKGKAAWIIGPSGIGKSTLATDFAIPWALGRPSYGMTPCGSLRSLIIQAENDRYDLAEMVQGIGDGHGLDAHLTPDDWRTVTANVLFITETRSTGEAFAARLHRLIDKHKPAIVWVDPMLAFMGIDVSRQVEVTKFLREVLGPVLEATGVVLIGLHHTGKPPPPKQTQGYTAIDFAYVGLGSSELVNWARAVMFLRPIDDINFELKLAKRGGRARATNPDGSWTNSIWLRHSTEGIRWQQIDPPKEDEETKGKDAGRSGRPSKVDELLGIGLGPVYDTLTAPIGKNDLAKAIEDYAAKRSFDCSRGTCLRVIEKLVKNRAVIKTENGYMKA